MRDPIGRTLEHYRLPEKVGTGDRGHRIPQRHHMQIITRANRAVAPPGASQNRGLQRGVSKESAGETEEYWENHSVG